MPQSYAYRWLTQAMVTLLGLGAGALGLSLSLGGPARFQSASFAVARLVPGGCYSWAALFLIAGALTLLGGWRKHMRLTRIGLLVEAIGFLIFDFGLIASVSQDPHTPVTGCATYAMVAAVCLAVWGTSKELT